MSGIAGFVHCSGEPADPSDLEVMTSSMKHRGPDGIRHWCSGPAALGHCMLFTTPQSLDESQPHINQNGTQVLAMDGRIDNCQEVRSLLYDAGYEPHSKTDAELVSRSFEKWGPECFEHLDGDFAIALWDNAKQTLHCARDRTGQKPFFYHWNGTCFTFASELSSILALPWVCQKINEGIIAEILSDQYRSLDETFWSGVFRLQPAHIAKICSGHLRINRYWMPSTLNDINYKKQDEYVEHYRELLFDTVRRFSRCHKTLGCEVSGGLDSSAIFSVGAELVDSSKFMAPDLMGYTLSFPAVTDANELHYARAVAAHLRRPIQEISPAFETLDWHLNFAREHKVLPLAPNNLMHGGIQKAMTRDGCVVALHGLGGDEWLSGSPNTYAESIALRDWDAFSVDFRSDLETKGLLKSIYAVPRYGLLPLLPDAIKAPLRRIRASEEHRSSITLSQEMAAHLSKQIRKYTDASSTRPKGSRHKPQIAHLSNAYALFAREASEHFASLDGIELRAPLNSRAMIEFSLSTPVARRMRDGIDRAIHRQSLVGTLPEIVRMRQSKAEFSSVYQHYSSALSAHRRWQTDLNARDWLSQNQRPLHSGGSDVQANLEPDEFRVWAMFSCVALSLAIKK